MIDLCSSAFEKGFHKWCSFLCFPSSLLTWASAFGTWLQAFFTRESGRSGTQHCDLLEALSVTVLITLTLLVTELFLNGEKKPLGTAYLKNWFWVPVNEHPVKTMSSSIIAIILPKQQTTRMVQEVPTIFYFLFLGKWPQYFFSFRWQHMTSFSQLLLLEPVPHLHLHLLRSLWRAVLPLMRRLCHPWRILLFHPVESQLLVGKPGPWRPAGCMYLDVFALQRTAT